MVINFITVEDKLEHMYTIFEVVNACEILSEVIFLQFLTTQLQAGSLSGGWKVFAVLDWLSVGFESWT